jgi:hypothetical protein
MWAALLGVVVGVGCVLYGVAVWRAGRGPQRPPGRSEVCPSCRHDLLAHRMNIGSTKCQCCLRSRGLAQKNR